MFASVSGRDILRTISSTGTGAPVNAPAGQFWKNQGMGQGMPPPQADRTNSVFDQEAETVDPWRRALDFMAANPPSAEAFARVMSFRHGDIAAPKGEPASNSALTDLAARDLIQGYFKSHLDTSVFPDEIAEALDLDVVRTIRICRQMKMDGEIE